MITMPESLMAKVLKGKYFPNSSFFEANTNPNASFTWKSILGAKKVVMKGVCRVIGNGKTTRIWHDPWLPSAKDSIIPQRDIHINENDPYYVSDLIEEGRWKNDMLAQFFSPRVSQEIRKWRYLFMTWKTIRCGNIRSMGVSRSGVHITLS